jgi:microcin C transport system substrate-binding protein
VFVQLAYRLRTVSVRFPITFRWLSTGDKLTRKFLHTAALLSSLVLSSFTASGALAVDWTNGSALTGTPRLPQSFANFPYVNPQAPKGGTVRQGVVGSFDSFNDQIIKGEPAPFLSNIYQTLMTPSLDELDISSQYGLIAEATKYPDDFSSVSFRLNPKAKWHDGEPITVDDVIWSFTKLKEVSPQYAFYFANVIKAEASAPGEVTFTFDVKGNRELPHIMGQLPVFPKHWWEGKDASGTQRNFAEPTTEPPLGSGPYKVGKFELGRFVEYNRVPDYWAKDLNTDIGTNNFDILRYDLYGDETVMIEAFKADAFDYRFERSSKNWSTGYTALPALDKGFVIKEEFPNLASGKMQAFVPNTRRDKFKDPRVRRALNLAFDFETTNRNAFFGLYERIPSYFAGTELASSGLPAGKELDMLNEVKADIPPEVFTSPYINPVGGDLIKMRENYREAIRLLKDAGWSLKGGKLVSDKTAEPFTIEYLDYSEVGKRYVDPYAQSLEKIGITVSYRILDTSAYQERVRKFDYDMIGIAWGESLSPGNEQREYWGSASASREGSKNYAGIQNAGVDKLIDKVIFASDRDTLVAATHALDRVLLANNYVIPQWYSHVDRYVYWDRFARPSPLPKYNFGFPSIWWFDQAKADRIKQ